MSAPSRPEAAQSAAESFFDAATVQPALAHSARVRIDNPPPWPIEAQVGGSQGYVVTVHHRGTHLAGDCSCEIGVDCKHAAAAALVVFAHEGEHAAARAAAVQQAAVGAWLTELGRVEKPATAPSSARSRKGFPPPHRCRRGLAAALAVP